MGKKLFRSWLAMCLDQKIDDGLLWDLDLKPHFSGDFSMSVVQANSNLEDQSQVYVSPAATFVGVYDGHGGSEASKFVNKHLFQFLREFEKDAGGLSVDVIKKAFRVTEEEFVRLVRRNLQFRPQVALAGTCCLVGVITKDVVHIANLGDSRVVLGKKMSKRQILVSERLSRDHNVGDEQVREEVRDLNRDDPSILQNCGGIWRIKGIIQVSRSIGDLCLKRSEFSREALSQEFGYAIKLKRPALSAEPEIISRKLEPDDLFLIFASDGLWEYLSDEEAVQIVLRNERSGIAKRLVESALRKSAKRHQIKYEEIKNIRKGDRRRFHDDITAIVIYLDQYKNDDFNDMTDTISSPVDIFASSRPNKV